MSTIDIAAAALAGSLPMGSPKVRRPRAAFVGFGEVNTDRAVVEKKCAEAKAVLAPLAELFDAGVVNDDGYAQADGACARIRSFDDFDCLVVCVAGWIPTHAVIRVIDRFRHKPMLLWGLCAWRESGKLVSTADQAGTTALRPAMRELGYRFSYVTSVEGGEPPVAALGSFLRAARAENMLRDARVGTMGYRDMLLYGTMFNGLKLRREVGIEVEPFETLEMFQKANAYTPEELAPVAALARSEFAFTSDCPDSVLEPSCRYALAVSEKVLERGYSAVSLIDVDGMKKLLGLPPAFIFNLVDLITGASTIPENDIMGMASQLMVRFATGQIAAYAEFYEFYHDGFIIGVPDFIPREVTDGDAKIRPSTFGLLSTSLLNVSSFKPGFITMARLVDADTEGKYKLHLALGDAEHPEAWEESGWAPPAPQLPSLRVHLRGDMGEFAEKVAGQHIIISYGDNTAELRALASLLGIEVI